MSDEKREPNLDDVMVHSTVTIVILGLTVFSVAWQQKICRLRARNTRVLVQIAEAMGCFVAGPNGESLYPDDCGFLSARGERQ
jgi:hypothetical protein